MEANPNQREVIVHLTMVVIEQARLIVVDIGMDRAEFEVLSRVGSLNGAVHQLAEYLDQIVMVQHEDRPDSVNRADLK